LESLTLEEKINLLGESFRQGCPSEGLPKVAVANENSTKFQKAA
jgi:hypothetical protein